MTEASQSSTAVSAADPRKALGAGCDVWGQRRLDAALTVKRILDGDGQSAPLAPWFIESGTLLGAWRSGKFIPHDDDFDIGVCLAGWDTAVSELEALRLKIEVHLPEPYKIRLVTSYCDKLEVYDPTQGAYTLPGKRYLSADYHYVTVDLQSYAPWPENPDVLAPRYRAAPNNYQVKVDKSFVLPVGSLKLEGQEWPSPRNHVAFLETMYGYLGEGARYCEKTGFYLPPEGHEKTPKGKDEHGQKSSKLS